MKKLLCLSALIVYFFTCCCPPSATKLIAPIAETAIVQPLVVPPGPTYTPVPLSPPIKASLPTDTPTPVLTPVPPTPTATPMPVSPPAVTEAGQVGVSPIDGAEMVYVPAGEFTMGSTEAEVDSALALCNEFYMGRCERDWFEDEQPQHRVYLDAFYIDKTEVTNVQYRQCVEAGACQAPMTCDWGEPTYGDASKADHPVVCVSWNNADAYCRWAGKRLPTEAEWEKAARGTDGRAYPWGNTVVGSKLNLCDRNCSIGWRDTSVDDGYANTAPVGSYPDGASPYGALDIAGNVMEWIADWFDLDYYSQSPGRNPLGPDSGPGRVLRGGSWYGNQGNARCTARLGYIPRSRLSNVGFRCARSSP